MGSIHFLLAILLFASNLCITAAAQFQSVEPKTPTNSTSCSCGYYDSTTGELFTESIIVYFNETKILPPDFEAQLYTNPYEKNWNAIFREAANASNTLFDNSTGTLELHVSPPRSDHVVMGGGIRSLRSDIQYGSFRSLLQPSHKYVGGSSLSMMLQFNESQSIQMNVMNTDSPSTAWVSTLMGDEFSSRDMGMNFSDISSNSSDAISAWDYTEYRIDWTEKEVDWYIGGMLSRSAVKSDSSLPTTPCPIFLKHWSIGDQYAMEGPPESDSVANVGWARLFFNSSLMTEAGHTEFDSQCDISSACSTEDLTLRGSSPFPVEATIPWKQTDSRTVTQWIAVWMAVSSITVSTLLLLHTCLLRTVPKFRQNPDQRMNQTTEQNSKPSSMFSAEAHSSTEKSALGSVISIPLTSGISTRFQSGSVTPVGTPNSADLREGNRSLDLWKNGGSARTIDFELKGLPTEPHSPFDSRAATVVDLTFETSSEDNKSGLIYSALAEKQDGKYEGKVKNPEVTITEIPATPITNAPLQPRTRIDHLAGLTAIVSLLVSVVHFCSTFVPAIIMPGAPVHYHSEVVANNYVSPFLLNQIWVGVFFTCSTRFLVSRYLRDGKLVNVAEKAVSRNFRVIIPIAGVAILEYFLIESGVTKWLEYLPSITWSTWPYTVGYSTFLNFLSEILELMYLIPNAAPQITYNYCTGVLWTIPVQLQGSWLILIGVIVTREIKKPWKRMCYYAFCVIMHWYAASWGTYFWLGLMMTDLDTTFKYRKWALARPFVFWPLSMIYFLLSIVCLSVDVANQTTTFSFVTKEYGIHPDPITGLPINQTDQLQFPPYFVPRLNGLIFSICCQSLVELSPALRKVFGAPILLWIFPHIFTIYLFHGLIFWSLGSMICVFLSVHGFAYWSNMCITALCCYVALILSLPFVTPIVEILGKKITSNIWDNAYNLPSPRRPTLFPFSKDLLQPKNEGDGGD